MLAGMDQTMTTGEAAKALGLAPRTIRDWCDKGKLPFWRSPSGRREIAASVIEAILAEREEALSG